MITYSQLTKIQKIQLVTSLRLDRINLLNESKKRQAAKGTTKRKKKQLKFTSLEHEKLFNGLSIEAKKVLLG